MENANLFFSKGERQLLSGLIRGQIPENANKVPVSNYSVKVSELLSRNHLLIQPATVRQKIFWTTNDQDVFRAVYQLLQAERPNELKQVFTQLESQAA